MQNREDMIQELSCDGLGADTAPGHCSQLPISRQTGNLGTGTHLDG
jgi:hypothetical protein